MANSDVTTKYQEAAKIANAVLEGKTKEGEPGGHMEGGTHQFRGGDLARESSKPSIMIAAFS